MKTRIMGPLETQVSAMNLNSIESHLGHRVPAGMIDTTQLGDRILGPIEVQNIAMNIRTIEYEREAQLEASGYRVGSSPGFSGFVLDILSILQRGIIVGAILFLIIASIIALFS